MLQMPRLIANEFGSIIVFLRIVNLQSALLLQDTGVLYMTLKAASGGPSFAQFVCQRVLPTLGLQPNHIEGEPLPFLRR
jgi:hypothetical protein